MSVTKGLLEINKCTEEELQKLRDCDSQELERCQELFCKDESFSERKGYKQILRCCTKIVTKDGKTVYVAKKRYIGIIEQHFQYENQETIIDKRDGYYIDVTALSNQHISHQKKEFKNVNDNLIEEGHSTLEWKVPQVQEGSKLFFFEETLL